HVLLFSTPSSRAHRRLHSFPTRRSSDLPEAQLHVLSEPLAGKDAIELGCGTAYISAWLARRGARVVGIDNSEAQLATARRIGRRSEEHTSELQSRENLVCRLLLEKKKKK